MVACNPPKKIEQLSINEICTLLTISTPIDIGGIVKKIQKKKHFSFSNCFWMTKSTRWIRL